MFIIGCCEAILRRLLPDHTYSDHSLIPCYFTNKQKHLWMRKKRWTDGLKWVNKSSNLKHSSQSKPKAEALRVQELWKRRFAASRVSTPEVGSIGEITMESFVLLLHQPDFWRQKHNSVSSWSGQYFLKGFFFFLIKYTFQKDVNTFCGSPQAVNQTEISCFTFCIPLNTYNCWYNKSLNLFISGAFG